MQLESDLALPPAGAVPSLLFLDLDEVLCLNESFGGRHAHHGAYNPGLCPPDLYTKLFSREAVDALNILLDEVEPRTVLTTSWVALLQRHHFVDLFRRTGLERVGTNFHPVWDAAADRGVSRLAAIDQWLARHHRDEPYLILDDIESGESLIDSTHAKVGRTVFCEVGRGFHAGHLPAALQALMTPFSKSQPTADGEASPS